jgi:hypothetical protein
VSSPLLQDFDELREGRQRQLDALRREAAYDARFREELRDTEKRFRDDPFGRKEVEAMIALEKRWAQEHKRQGLAGNVKPSADMQARAKASLMRRVSWTLSEELKKLGHNVSPESGIGGIGAERLGNRQNVA